MTRRQIAAKAFDAEHKKLMLAIRHSRGAARVAALNALKEYMTGRLSAGK